MTDVEKDLLCSVLLEFHEVFSLEKGECGETDLVELHIDTGEQNPIDSKEDMRCSAWRGENVGRLTWSSCTLIRERQNPRDSKEDMRCSAWRRENVGGLTWSSSTLIRERQNPRDSRQDKFLLLSGRR